MLSQRLATFSLLMLAGCAGLKNPDPAIASSPPVDCREALGAWCIRDFAARDVSSEHLDDSDTYLWTISDASWDGEYLTIKEPSTCRSVEADEVTVSEDDLATDDDGRQRQSLLLSLRSDGRCNLQISLDNERSYSRGWANAPGIIAACIQINECSDNPVVKYIAQDYIPIREKRDGISIPQP